MKLKKIDIGEITTENNLFFAPIAGYSDFAFRHICSLFGAGLTFTELVSAKGLFYNSQGTEALLHTTDAEKIKAVQLFGEDPYFMRKACESEQLEKFDIVDINMGCPVPKVFKNGEGSALLKDIKKAEMVVKECVKSGKPITVKIRIGLEEGNFITEDYAKMLEGAGAKLVSIHGRVRTAYYSGAVNFDEIKKAKSAVKIPIIANGGVFNEKDADEIMDRTNADGVMIARGALGNPQIFSELSKKEMPKQYLTDGKVDKKKIILDYVDMLFARFGDRYTAVNFRKIIPYFLKGEINSKETKLAFFKAETTKELKSLVERYF